MKTHSYQCIIGIKVICILTGCKLVEAEYATEELREKIENVIVLEELKEKNMSIQTDRSGGCPEESDCPKKGECIDTGEIGDGIGWNGEVKCLVRNDSTNSNDEKTVER